MSDRRGLHVMIGIYVNAYKQTYTPGRPMDAGVEILFFDLRVLPDTCCL